MPSPKKLSEAKRPKPATQRVRTTDSGRPASTTSSPEGSTDTEEEEALLELYREVCDRAAKTIQHPHDAEDAAHEAILALLGERRRAVRFLAAYAVVVMKNHVRAEFRRKSRLTLYAPQDLLGLATHVDCPSQPGCAATDARLALLGEFRASLSDSGRAMFDALRKESTIRGAARHCACRPKDMRRFRNGLQNKFRNFAQILPPLGL